MSKQKTISLALLVSILILSLTTNVRGEGSLPVLVGIYPSGMINSTVSEINVLDSYLGKPTISIAGAFLDLESPVSLVKAELDASWDNGYVPFVNLSAGYYTPRSAQDIGNGVIDGAIRNWAQTYATWSQGGAKRAFIAPLQEMNGRWVTYGIDPANYVRAYLRIQQIFLEEGVPSDSVSWVFAPNGWHDVTYGDPPFEAYYPGDAVVDVVGFSSFNFGNCWSYTATQSYEQMYKPFLDRMAVRAPGKPIFIAEIGSVPDGLDRSAWFSDTLSKIGAYPGVRAILYFNRTEFPSNYQNPPICNPVDYSLDAGDGGGHSGEGKDAFKQQVTNPPYGYWAKDSVEMVDIAFNRPNATFEDGWPASAFSGKSTTPYYQPWVERLVNAGITSGCSSSIIDFNGVSDFTFRYYCPDDSVTRAQMSVFLERGVQGASFIPPAVVGGTGFNDVPDTYWAAAWIKQLSFDGITGGCGSGIYCPESPVTRAQMAVFLLKSKHGKSYAPPALSGGNTGFDDVPASHWAAAWIKQLAAEGITSGCSASEYCPENPVTRGQMAIFLVRTFNLP